MADIYVGICEELSMAFSDLAGWGIPSPAEVWAPANGHGSFATFQDGNDGVWLLPVHPNRYRSHMQFACHAVSDALHGGCMLEVLYEDEWLIAINKPAGLMVHRSWLGTAVEEVAVQLLRDQMGRWVQPVHRLDRPTSGVLVFAYVETVAKALMEAFAAHRVCKHYLAVVRGFLEGEGTLDYPLRREVDAYTQAATAVMQPAITHWRSLGQVEFPQAVGKFPTARFSLVGLRPETGRKHQLRRHLAHLRHPIIGDTRHGDGVQNRFAREKLGVQRLLLHASRLELEHPVTGAQLDIAAPLDPEFERLFWLFGQREGAD
jgi:tRNA pseudouridine65 synthase